VPVFVAGERAVGTADCSRASISCTAEAAAARVFGYVSVDLWSARRAAVNCSVLLRAGTFQICNWRA